MLFEMVQDFRIAIKCHGLKELLEGSRSVMDIFNLILVIAREQHVLPETSSNKKKPDIQQGDEGHSSVHNQLT